MTKQLKMYGLLLLVLSLTASCAMLGKEAPRDYKDQIAYASALQESITDAVKQGYFSGSISATRADKMRNQLHDARGFLLSASVFLDDGDLVNVQGRLALANNILSLLKMELKNK